MEGVKPVEHAESPYPVTYVRVNTEQVNDPIE